MLIRANLYSNQMERPRDTQKQFFLLRVVHQVGEVIFGTEWTGHEPDCKLVVETEDEADAFSMWQGFNAIINSSAQYPQARQCFEGETVNDDYIDRLTKIAKGFEEQVALANVRYEKAAELVVEACSNEKLITCLRPLNGGDYSAPLPATLWNFENWHRRLFEGRLDPARPYEDSWIEHETKWIYVESKSVQRFLDSLRATNAVPLSYISDETRCTRWLTDLMKASPTLKPKSKTSFCAQAIETFKVTNRGFDRSWNAALKETRSNWNKAGRPKQSY